MMTDGKSFTKSLVEDVTADPDGPKNSDRAPPQTTDAEPTSDDPRERPDVTQR